MAKHRKKQSVRKGGKARGKEADPTRVEMDAGFGHEQTIEKLIAQADGAAGDKAEKETALVEALRLNPFSVKALVRFAQLRLSQGRPKDALLQQQRAFMLSPRDPLVVRRLTETACYAGQQTHALYAARHWVDLEPDNATALGTFSGLLGNMGYEDQSIVYAREYVRRSPLVKIEAQSQEKIKVLVLQTKVSGANRFHLKSASMRISEGHNNLPSVLDPKHITKEALYVDILENDEDYLQKLTDYDLVLNNITDPSRCARALEHAERICDYFSNQGETAVLNHPRQVLECNREAHAKLASQYDRMIFPKAVNLGVLEGDISDTIRDAVRQHGFEVPVIMRAAGYQGGKHMHRLEDLERLKVRLEKPSEVHLIQYHEVGTDHPQITSSVLYPKYRAMLVGGQLFPVHVFWGIDNFNVHRKDSLKAEASYPSLVEEGSLFLRSPEHVVGQNAWIQLRELMQSTGLDYAGVDFAVSSDLTTLGQLVIFEMNPAMRNWMTSLPETDAVQQAWVAVTLAAHKYLCHLAGKPEWEFALPKPADEVSEERRTS